MKLFLGLSGHANNESLPLRFGIRITKQHQQFPTLENYKFDEIGTEGQRHIEINKGNKHYIGDLHIKNENPDENSHVFNCRVVLGTSITSHQSPPIITILRPENNKGDITVTKHISGMLKRGKITFDDLISYFHPRYLTGEILDSNDCEATYDSLHESRPFEVIAITSADDMLLESAEKIKDVVTNFEIDGTDLTSPLTYKQLCLSPKIKFRYLMADAYIEDVWRKDEKIWIRIINSKGNLQDLHSFKIRDHLSQHHDYTMQYLTSRIGQRAYFSICNSEPCNGFLAESVTSIALKLMR